MTKIKICGLTRVEDAVLAAELGADFLGFIFVPSSPRLMRAEDVAGIRSKVPGPHFVGVFQNATIDEMRTTAAIAGLDYLQLHGSEDEDTVRAVGKPVIKGVHVAERIPPIETSAAWVLFDTYDPKQSGGTGRRFDWSLLATYDRTKPFLLAGGITPDNVAEAVDAVHPDAIDLASGVESAPGIKDHHKLRMLFERVRSR